MKDIWRKIFTILLIAFFFVSIPFLLVMSTEPEPSIDSSMPVLSLSLKDTDLNTIIQGSKDTKYEGNSLSVTTGTGTTTYENVEIKGHGNSTWNRPKSPFQISLSSKADFLNLGKSKKWVLLANYFDKSNLRNDIAFYIEHLLDMNYAIDGKFVDLYINDEYLGLYYLAEKVEIGKERVNITDNNSILVELNNLHSAVDPCDAITEEHSCLVLKDSRNESDEHEAFKRFSKNFNTLEQAAKKGDYETVKKLADIDSFAKYFILSDITVNPDAYASSFYLYQKNDKIYAGPGWDFDLALSNRVWVWPRTNDFYLPETTRVMEKYALGGKVYDEALHQYVELVPDNSIAHFVFWLYQIPEFQHQVKQIYHDHIYGKKNDVIAYMKSKIEFIRPSAIRDRELWREYDNGSFIFSEDADKIAPKILYTDLSVEDAFDAEIEYLIDWVYRRLDFLDKEYSIL